MEMKTNFQFSVRGYEASDRRAVRALLSEGVLEHVHPAVFRTLAHPDHVGVALSVCVAGYVLGGSSYFQALLFGGAWAGLLYHCCLEVYRGHLRRRLTAADRGHGRALADGAESGLWVAEAEVAGRTRVVGVAAVRGRKGQAGGRAQRAVDWTVGLQEKEEEEQREEHEEEHEEEEEEEGAVERYGELSLVVVSYGCRRRGLGSLLAQKALGYCQGRGYTSLVAGSSSPQTGANALYRKLGFVQTASHCEAHANRWVSRLARVDVLTLEKLL